MLEEIIFRYGIGFNWYQPKIIQIKRKASEFIIDETLLKAGENYVWLWIAIEPIDKIVLGIYFYRKKYTCS